MNRMAREKLRQGIAIALKQFPELRQYDKISGIYIWERYNEDGVYCWYIGKAKNLLHRTAQHIMDGQSHLDKSIKKHGLFDREKNPKGWSVLVVTICNELELDKLEQRCITDTIRLSPHGKMYNIESGGTTGKTIIGEKKQRRDVKWKAEAKNKVLADYREYFDLKPKENAYNKNTKELKSKPKQLHDEFYV